MRMGLPFGGMAGAEWSTYIPRPLVLVCGDLVELLIWFCGMGWPPGLDLWERVVLLPMICGSGWALLSGLVVPCRPAPPPRLQTGTVRAHPPVSGFRRPARQMAPRPKALEAISVSSRVYHLQRYEVHL